MPAKSPTISETFCAFSNRELSMGQLMIVLTLTALSTLGVLAYVVDDAKSAWPLSSFPPYCLGHIFSSLDALLHFAPVLAERAPQLNCILHEICAAET